MRFDTLLSMADKLQKYKYVVRTTAKEHGYSATFMPKPIFGDNGSGMHVHQSLWKDGQPLFFDSTKYALLSDTARWYIGGVLKHAPALLAICAPTTNPYLAFAAMMMAGLDGIQNQIEPPAPLNVDIYELSAEEKAGIASTPGSLAEALTALEEDHEFLLRGGVFTKDLLESFIEIKRSKDIVNVALRPHPYEFFMYYDA